MALPCNCSSTRTIFAETVVTFLFFVFTTSLHPRELNIAAEPIPSTFKKIFQLSFFYLFLLYSLGHNKFRGQKRSKKPATRLLLNSRFQHHGQLTWLEKAAEAAVCLCDHGSFHSTLNLTPKTPFIVTFLFL